jgi:5-methylcytosine-specific restriction endonuclease McrA
VHSDSPLKSTYGRWLALLGKAVSADMAQVLSDPAIRIVRSPKAWPTETWGYTVTVATVARDRRSALELWVDLFPDVGYPVLCVCYASSDRERIDQIAGANGALIQAVLTDSTVARTKQGTRVVASVPFERRFLGSPLVEHYRHSYCSTYLREPARPGSSTRPIVQAILRIAIPLLRAASTTACAPGDFPTVENRSAVALHLRRERSAVLAARAKDRDGFTCQVCNFNFAEAYGEFARGYAEAHHIVPLAMLRDEGPTTLSDLVTVCANCHRALHRMTGKRGDLGRLVAALERRSRTGRTRRNSGLQLPKLPLARLRSRKKRP